MSRGNRVVLTITMIKAMKQGQELWDAEVPGLHVRAGVRGKAFLFAYHSPRTRQQRRGGFGIISLDQARKKGSKWRDLIATGIDPLEEQKAEREMGPPPTLKDLEIRWEVEAKKSEKQWTKMVAEQGKYEIVQGQERDRAFSFMKPKTLERYRKHWKDILGNLGEDKKLTLITVADLDALHQDLTIKKPRDVKGPPTGGPVVAGQVMIFLSTLMKEAVMWGLLEEQDGLRFPTMFGKIKKAKGRKRIHHFHDVDMPKLYAGLERLKNMEGKGRTKKKEDLIRSYLIELLFATGSRISEFMSAKLSWIDWTGQVKVIRLWDTKTGSRTIPLGKKVTRILKQRCEEWHKGGCKPEDDWVLPSPRKLGAPLTNPRKGLKSFLKKCDIDPSLTPHTIRHTVVTWGLHKAGLTLEQVAAITGHKSTDTTALYAHTIDADTVISMDRITDALDAAMSGTVSHDENDIVPDYIRMQRENAKRLQVELPHTSTTH